MLSGSWSWSFPRMLIVDDESAGSEDGGRDSRVSGVFSHCQILLVRFVFYSVWLKELQPSHAFLCTGDGEDCEGAAALLLVPRLWLQVLFCFHSGKGSWSLNRYQPAPLLFTDSGQNLASPVLPGQKALPTSATKTGPNAEFRIPESFW